MKLALIGKKLSHSYSEIIHNIFFDLTGISGTYSLVEIDSENKVGLKLDELEKSGFNGINITIPYKKKVIEFVDSTGDEVVKLKAANTIVFNNGLRYAYNTDYFGFMKTLVINGVEPKGKKWLVLGSGGGAKSVAAVLEDMGASKIITASTSQSGTNFIKYNEIMELHNMFGVVNTTPIGMYPDVKGCVLEKEQIGKFKVAVDIVYNPMETVFLKRARGKGLSCVTGLYMLVAQAVKAQEIWNGRKFGDEIINGIYTELEKRL